VCHVSLNTDLGLIADLKLGITFLSRSDRLL